LEKTFFCSDSCQKRLYTAPGGGLQKFVTPFRNHEDREAHEVDCVSSTFACFWRLIMVMALVIARVRSPVPSLVRSRYVCMGFASICSSVPVVGFDPIKPLRLALIDFGKMGLLGGFGISVTMGSWAWLRDRLLGSPLGSCSGSWLHGLTNTSVLGHGQHTGAGCPQARQPALPFRRLWYAAGMG
jgi:hypothetical protein